MTSSKSELRRLVRAREQELEDGRRSRLDGLLVEKLLAREEFISARRVLLYRPVGREIDVTPVILASLELSKTTALPRITSPGVMEARAVSSLSGLVPGPYGIPEPPDTCPLIPPEDFDLILVPGAAFTREGMRLGRGGGYYDRYLPQTHGVKISLARPEAVFAHLPTQPHDVAIDILLTLSPDEL